MAVSIAKIGQCAQKAIFSQKWQNLDTKMAKFGPKMAKTGFFSQNPKMSLPYAYNATTSCKKLEKSHERILRSSSHGRTHGRTHGQR